MQTQLIRSILIAVALVLSGCVSTLPPNVTRAGENMLKPAPGFNWNDPTDPHAGVHWVPGQVCVDADGTFWPNVIASRIEGGWIPVAGYTWRDTDSSGRPISGRFAVRWEPGRPYTSAVGVEWPNIESGEVEGTWLPRPGYKWVKADGSGRPPPGSLEVHWNPGCEYRQRGVVRWPKIVASDDVDHWRPVPGYEWAHLDANGHPIPGEFAVVSSAMLAAERERWRPLNERWIAYLAEIQSDGDYENWTAPPLDLYKSRFHRH
jgi:hypothetical protein